MIDPANDKTYWSAKQAASAVVSVQP